MLGKDTMEKASTEVTSIQRRNLFREIIDTLSILKVESTSNIFHNFQVNFPFEIDESSTWMCPLGRAGNVQK